MDEEPRIDESKLTEEERKVYKHPLFRWQWLIVWGVLLLLITGCAIAIALLS